MMIVMLAVVILYMAVVVYYIVCAIIKYTLNRSYSLLMVKIIMVLSRKL